ncbi:MAG TPA: histone deacetylase, partial [Verrucomicrobiae bacterium]|nr:histone deacetylase [Verrucomicrobiae bacterium]
HAVKDKSMGFCLFNNVAVGAMYARQQFGFERVMIIDWDVHHGNGIQDAFYDSPNVLYFSTHLQASWPGTGWVSKTGRGEGEGYNINVPLAKGTGDPGFYMVFSRLLEPVIWQFKPELIIISAGFDAHFGDPLGGLEVTCDGFARMAEIIKKAAEEICQGRVVLALEGGYNLDVIGHAVSAVLNVFGEYGLIIDDPIPEPPRFVKPTMMIPIDEAMKIHGRRWKLG